MNKSNEVVWPGWETTRLIGRGSFGAVYEIQRDVFGDIEKAALKVITIPQNDSDIREMLVDGYDEESITSAFKGHLKNIVTEYSLMRKMNGSSNIVNCDDFRYELHDDGIGWDIFIKMELLTSLADVLPEAIPEVQVLRVAEDMCSALELCAKHNIVHRDIKPQNIFVSPNGDYKLGDFGIAKTVEKTMGGTKTGTYKYMAPEVYSNRPYNHTADIYSLGLVLYWMLNERRMPFMPLPPEKLNVGTDEESRNRRFSGEAIPAPKNGSKELKRIVLKACAFDPKERYQTAREMREDVVRLTRGYAAEPPQDFIPVPDNHGDSDDHTVGPVFKPAPVAETEAPDCTVGPIFGEKTETAVGKHETKQQKTTGKKVRYILYKVLSTIEFAIRFWWYFGMLSIISNAVYSVVVTLLAMWVMKTDKDYRQSVLVDASACSIIILLLVTPILILYGSGLLWIILLVVPYLSRLAIIWGLQNRWNGKSRGRKFDKKTEMAIGKPDIPQKKTTGKKVLYGLYKVLCTVELVVLVRLFCNTPDSLFTAVAVSVAICSVVVTLFTMLIMKIDEDHRPSMLIDVAAGIIVALLYAVRLLWYDGPMGLIPMVAYLSRFAIIWGLQNRRKRKFRGQR